MNLLPARGSGNCVLRLCCRSCHTEEKHYNCYLNYQVQRANAFAFAGKDNYLTVQSVQQPYYALHLVTVPERDDNFAPALFIDTELHLSSKKFCQLV